MIIGKAKTIFISLLVVGILFYFNQGLAEDPMIFVNKAPLGGEIIKPLYTPDEIIVKFRAGTRVKDVEDFNQTQEAEEIYESPYAHFKVLKIPKTKTVEEMINIYSQNPNVEYAEPNYYAYALMVPNDPYYQYQWHFDDNSTKNPGGATSNPYGGANGGGIRMEEAWDLSTGNSSVIAAIIDTGVAYEDYPIPDYEKNTVKSGVTTYKKAPDLAQTNFWLNSDEIAGNGVDDDGNGYIDDVNGWDFVVYTYKGNTYNGDNHPNDNNAHGTHVAGTIAQSTNNNLGVAGIAFNITIMPIKVLDHSGSGTYAAVADGIYYATNNGAKIINLSLGGPSSTTLENAVAYAYNNGATVIAASGNEGASSVSYPAAYNSYVIAVGATRYDETRSPYSNYGSSLDLVAPGGDVTVNQNDDYGCPTINDPCGDGVLQQTFKPYTSPGSKADPADFAYWFFQGTSMATPHVVGLAALLLSVSPNLTPNEVRSILQTTAEDKGIAGWDQYYGWGIIDAYSALSSISLVSISLNTDGVVDFGILPLNSTRDTTPSGTNDVQTVRIDTGPANLDIRTTLFSDGTNNWTLGSVNGASQAVWEYSKEGTAWDKFLAANTLYSLASNVSQTGTQDVYFRLTMPTSSTSSNQYSSTVTIVATSP